MIGGAARPTIGEILRTTGRRLRDAAASFWADEPFRLAAALSFYSLLSMAPLLLVVVATTGYFLGEGTVRAELIAQIRSLVGSEGATVAETVLYNRPEGSSNAASMLLGLALTLFGATTVFAQLQSALNSIWRVQAKPTNAVLSFLKSRLLSFALVLSIGFLLMVSLVVSALLAALRTYVAGRFEQTAAIMETANLLVSFGLATLLIAMIFKYLPDRQIRWRDTWFGGALTAALLAAGKSVIGLYLGQASIGSVFGAAGSAVVFMLWVYYAALIFFFGAELTKVMARDSGDRPPPDEHAAPA